MRPNPLAALALTLSLASPALAQDTPSIATVMASVNGTDITLGELILARGNLPEQFRELPDEALLEGLLEQMIQQELLAQSLSATPPKTLAPSLAVEIRALEASAAIQEFIGGLDLEAAVQRLYEQRFANAEPDTEFNASHILVETEEDALAVIQQFETGIPFADLAREHSTGPSGPSGGTLGWFGRGQMVPEFEAAVADMEPGQISTPVQTQFGWHVIMLNDTRLQDAPPLEQVRAQLEAEAQRGAIDARISELQEASSITRNTDGIDPNIMSDPALFE